MASSAHEFDSTSMLSDNLSLSLKLENRSSYGGINSNMNEDQSMTDKTSEKKTQNKNTKSVTFQWDIFRLI